MSVLDEWTVAACRELGLDPTEARTKVVLDLARDVAHNVVRPGAPVTAYLLGVAVGRGADPAEAGARLAALAAAWGDAADRDAGPDRGSHGVTPDQGARPDREARADKGERLRVVSPAAPAEGAAPRESTAE